MDTAMDDAELNERIREFDGPSGYRNERTPERLERSEKVVAYYGWYWRDVDFSRPISFAYADGAWVGFCENNKWGYEQFHLSQEETDAVRAACVALVEAPSRELATKLFDLMQSLKPADVTGKKRWDSED
jgi:hypothetical protein